MFQNTQLTLLLGINKGMKLVVIVNFAAKNAVAAKNLGRKANLQTKQIA